MSNKVTPMTRLGLLVISCLVAHASHAEGPNVWNGPYLGAQLGWATNSSCSRWISSGPGLDPAQQFPSQACGSGSPGGGLEVGENFQYGHVFWALAADLDFTAAKQSSRSSISNGTPLPAGTYSTSHNLSSNGFLLLAPRIGYAGREFAPYLRAGALLAFGARDDAITYKPPGVAQPTASFNGAKSYDTIGWAAGGGIEWGLYGPWSIGFEYMHANLGKGSNASASCAGTVAACQRFSGIAFENSHTSFTFNMFRVAVNYYFDYW